MALHMASAVADVTPERGIPMADYILVLDEGTTSTRAMLFASDGVLVAPRRSR